MRSCIFLLLLASYLSGIASGNAYSYLGGENESYLCTRNGDEYKVDKPSNEGSCLQYCKNIQELVETMTESDKTAQQPKKCKETAEGLAALPDAFQKGGSTLEKTLKQIHEGNCLSALMWDWVARDAHCRTPGQGNSVINTRMLMTLLQYYSSYLDGEETPSPNHRRSINDSGASARRAAATLPDTKSFCLYQISEFIKDGKGGNLFDKELCGGMHPIWSDLGPGNADWCTKPCWNHIKSKIQDGGCLALYYETMFDMAFGVGREVEDEKATTKLVTVQSIVDKMGADSKPKIDDKCSKESREGKNAPCTGINDAIASCAMRVDESDYVRYTSKVEKTDAFGATTKGGIKCWQGANCH